MILYVSVCFWRYIIKAINVGVGADAKSLKLKHDFVVVLILRNQRETYNKCGQTKNLKKVFKTLCFMESTKIQTTNLNR